MYREIKNRYKYIIHVYMCIMHIYCTCIMELKTYIIRTYVYNENENDPVLMSALNILYIHIYVIYMYNEIVHDPHLC